jgi:hypothetical protein
MLSQKHLEELKKSGISDQVIELNFKTLTDHNEINSILKWKKAWKWKTGGWLVSGVNPITGEPRPEGQQFRRCIIGR